MNLKMILATIALALTGWIASASASPFIEAAPDRTVGASVNQLAQENRDYDKDRHDKKTHHRRQPEWDWYQGQRGRWHREDGRWQWRGATGDQWYQGQRGHWYRERNGWQFGTTGLICNNQGRNCRRGGYLPPNGQGMVNPKNPSLFWQCDSEGHNCHWARRPRY